MCDYFMTGFWGACLWSISRSMRACGVSLLLLSFDARNVSQLFDDDHRRRAAVLTQKQLALLFPWVRKMFSTIRSETRLYAGEPGFSPAHNARRTSANLLVFEISAILRKCGLLDDHYRRIRQAGSFTCRELLQKLKRLQTF